MGPSVRLSVNLPQINASQDILSSLPQKRQGDLCHLCEGEDKLSLPLQAELCQTHHGIILTPLYSVLILEAERKK